ncbi:uncharacterized protein LOC123549659 isoform X1 [Mercenaria mercenaria]|uniref:uncharacterized protein LOC123549659 isoform X1 n=1 Tax=Mercenaria mercenaria TaxID=6596 RepID=UPI00234F89B5|nr:uncharacterized protein LOC123549659 isoform X1 [Mercenaria mercenaria]XP_053401085.1 uncharacterized protein LOC123549659 isoform X1 [Mercenaria mercenaria]XP_053401086.1 uncharacterized protein LOC123549659 isoform X1 [Mercenaria mercenaria]
MMADTFEIAFSFDTTGSMYNCIEEVRRRLREMVQDLKRKIPGIRIAIFAHGDYCAAHSGYVTKHLDFTNDANTLCNFVSNVSMTSGGDIPECYELVMREVQEKLSWSTYSQKALVLIGDAPPHGKSESQNYRHLDWKEETEHLRKMDIKIYAVQCSYDSSFEYFYQHIAARTFGYYMRLSNISEVKDLLMKICFREAGLEDMPSSSVTTPHVFISTPYPEVVGKRSSPIAEMIAMESDDDDDESDDEYELRCFMCKKPKPPIEFPKTPISDSCNHYPGHCLRCVVEYVKRTGQCPHEECDVVVEPDCEMVNFFESKLDRMFVDYSKVLEENRKLMTGYGGPVFSVSAMNGDTAWVPYNPRMTVADLKREVEIQLGIKESQQKILYKERGLKTIKGPGQPFTLSDYGITETSSLSLIVPLYCIPENLDHVVFDLSWEFPKINPDFLDASCLAFEKHEFIQVIDWNHSTNDYYLKGAIQHSAKNVKTAGGRIGHQSIQVYLKRLPSNITHLYFTLSSWKAPNLSASTNPSLQFYEASDPGTNLCSTTISHALSSQAVVMCSVVRAGTQWQIFECDVSGCVDGNTKKYNPIQERIGHLIENE